MRKVLFHTLPLLAGFALSQGQVLSRQYANAKIRSFVQQFQLVPSGSLVIDESVTDDTMITAQWGSWHFVVGKPSSGGFYFMDPRALGGPGNSPAMGVQTAVKRSEEVARKLLDRRGLKSFRLVRDTRSVNGRDAISSRILLSYTAKRSFRGLKCFGGDIARIEFGPSGGIFRYTEDLGTVYENSKPDLSAAQVLDTVRRGSATKGIDSCDLGYYTMIDGKSKVARLVYFVVQGSMTTIVSARTGRIFRSIPSRFLASGG
jgi:hypothetical protein